jgi:hypothetical protein
LRLRLICLISYFPQGGTISAGDSGNIPVRS